MQLLDGKLLEKQIQAELKEAVDSRIQKGLKRPHLAAILVGDNPASAVYVRNKIRLCDAVGFDSTLIKKESSISEDELIDTVRSLNEKDDVDGFIVQLPLPKHIDEERVNLLVDPKKDVDGFHPVNIGRMTLGLPAYLPATPQGILTFLEKYKIETSGKHCVVAGRSNIVGRPISILMASNIPQGNATVTNVHSRTHNLMEICKSADILITAVGKANFITAEMVKEGAVLIDVGMNRVEDSSRKKGYRLVGDADFDAVAPKCSYITPVPGGVGRMTVVSLLKNTLLACENKIYD